MSKSFGNHVGLTEPPEEQFGKVMSIPDELIGAWLRLCTLVEPAEVDAVERGLADGSVHPAEQKRRVAREIVALYQGDESARAAEDRFDKVHRQHEIPEDVEDVEIPAEALRNGKVWLPRLMTAAGLSSSNADARRLIEQGGVRIDGEAVSDPDAEFARGELSGRVLQVGRRRFVRLR
jgi:tyrosyl-tRNA synthetase